MREKEGGRERERSIERESRRISVDAVVWSSRPAAASKQASRNPRGSACLAEQQQIGSQVVWTGFGRLSYACSHEQLKRRQLMKIDGQGPQIEIMLGLPATNRLVGTR